MPMATNEEEGMLELGALPPDPRDLTLCGPNGMSYNEDTWAEDRATQGCNLSADPSA